MSLCLLLLLTPPDAERMAPRPAPPPAGDPVSPEQLKRLSQTLKTLLLGALPDPLYEKNTGEGKTAPAMNGLKWRGLLPRAHYAEKNDGIRRHLKLTADNPARTFDLQMRNWQVHDQGRATFELHLKFAVRLAFTEERWRKGIKLYDGSVRARANLWMMLRCESTMTVAGDGFLPTIVYRLRVVDSEFAYNDLVFEHVAGLGGEAAQIIGDLSLDAIRQWKPSVERKLRDKLEQSIMKAAHDREIRIGLSGLSVTKAKDRR